MRFCCKTVPRLSKTAPPWRDNFSSEEWRNHILDMTESTAQSLLRHKSLNMPIFTNHREGGSVGRVSGGYQYGGALYHIGDIDESTEHGKFVADQIRSGNINQISLTHIPEDPRVSRQASNVELSLCVGNGARKGSGIIKVWENQDQPPEGVERVDAPPQDEYESERNYYVDQYSPQLIMASDESIVEQVAEFNNPDHKVPLVKMSNNSEEQPSVEVEEKKKESELLEERMAMWDKGLRPEDAKDGETYDLYVIRIADGVRMPSDKLKTRLMQVFADKHEREEKSKETIRCLVNLADSSIKKFGSRASPPVTQDELAEAERHLNAPAIQSMMSRMMMVQASEDAVNSEAEFRRQKELNAERERNLKLEQQVIAARAAEHERQLDREKRNEMMEVMRRRSKNPPPVTDEELIKDKELFKNKQLTGNVEPQSTDPVAKAMRKIQLQNAQSVLIQQLRERPDFKLEGYSEEETRALLQRLSNPGETQDLLSTQDYLARRGIGAVAAFPDARFSREYIPGQVSASEDLMASMYEGRGTISRNLCSPFNQNIDKAVIPVIVDEARRGNRDALKMGSYLQSSVAHICHGNTRGRGNETYRYRYSKDGERPVNGWRNAHSTMAKSSQAKAVERLRY